MLIFWTSAKLRNSWYWKVYFLKLHVSVSLRIKFQVSSIYLTSFRQVERGGGVKFYSLSLQLKTDHLKAHPDYV